MEFIPLIEHLREEIHTNVLVVFVEMLQDQETGDAQEDVSVAALQLVLELLVLVRCRLDYVREVDQVRQLLSIQEVVLA